MSAKKKIFLSFSILFFLFFSVLLLNPLEFNCILIYSKKSNSKLFNKLFLTSFKASFSTLVKKNVSTFLEIAYNLEAGQEIFRGLVAHRKSLFSSGFLLFFFDSVPFRYEKKAHSIIPKKLHFFKNEIEKKNKRNKLPTCRSSFEDELKRKLEVNSDNKILEISENSLAEAERLDDEIRESVKLCQEKIKNEFSKAQEDHTEYKYDEQGFKILNQKLIDNMSVEQMRKELRLRGYRTKGSKDCLYFRLLNALNQGPKLHRLEKLKSYLSQENIKIENEETKKAVAKYKLIEQKIKKGTQSSNPKDLLESFLNIVEYLDAMSDPVGHFNLDCDDNDNIDFFKNATISNVEDLKNETTMNSSKQSLFNDKEYLDLIDSIPKTYNFDPSYIDVPCTFSDQYKDISIEERKRIVLSREGGIADLTIEEASERFGVIHDFFGNYLCQNGCIPPIDINVPFRQIIDVAKLWEMLEILNIFDSIQINSEFPPWTLEMLAEKFEVDLSVIFKILEDMKIRVAFGSKSLLPKKFFEKLTRVLTDMNKAKEKKT